MLVRVTNLELWIGRIERLVKHHGGRVIWVVWVDAIQVHGLQAWIINQCAGANASGSAVVKSRDESKRKEGW